MFAIARQVAGTGQTIVPGATLEEALRFAVNQFGSKFEHVLQHSRVWVNGSDAKQGGLTPVGHNDEIAVIPAVAGG
ncbi:MoaD/ThiS family protein [Rhodococcus sp. NPDC059968]|uniref:MoaD/ThiS family protein n=1 Tax=Rhodococcus sp. NPDC059968 TaxID=3347017 RepID=UPI00366EBECF